MTKKDLILEILSPHPRSGLGELHWITEFWDDVPGFSRGNGVGDLRSDGLIGQKYRIRREKFYQLNAKDQEKCKKEFSKKNYPPPKPGTVVRVKADGIQPPQLVNPNHIPPAIRKVVEETMKRSGCAWTGLHTATLEIDHKDGRKMMPPANQQTPDMFQYLIKPLNDFKGQYCRKTCEATGERFDAMTLGFTISQTEGGSVFDKNALAPNGCVGCFLYDPKAFRSKLKT